MLCLLAPGLKWSPSNTEEALAAYRRAVALDPENPDGWNQLGHLLRRIGQIEEAENAYQHVLELGDSSQDLSLRAVAYGNLGNLYQMRGELDKAEEMYLKSLKINEALGRKEGMASEYGNLGILYQTRGELDKAEEMYLKSLHLFQAMGHPNAEIVQEWVKTFRSEE